ncbi:MAG: bifunctional (p)ppGpp synthetase/guanosine-3',5'-bis(diphosphate) 3'-pyrophosphohydrolase [Candidatus Carbobacillus sp.]|nr:bifunctional (p)ppGpp synthetase/guanosine-3',5'-bis(diphosphate) 3'-pyrophosphohydrolase [Candidatus Carbobacillus sp.]
MKQIETIPQYTTFIHKLKRYMHEKDVQEIEQAYAFAEEHHAGQYRISGDPYITHPLAVADILADLKMDRTIIIAALLHDVVEDTTVTLDDVRRHFGEEIATIVDGVTKLRRIQFQSKEEQQAENYRKMLIAMARDVRVILIKLADRLHNMRTLKFRTEEDQRRIAEETLEIYAPIAHRLGISAIKWELEDTALRYLSPQHYYRIVHLMKKKRAERESYIEKISETLRQKLSEMGIKADVYGRPKHIYSIYRKMYQQHKAFNEIYDLLAIRVIVEGVRECYSVLGIVHTLWKPMPGRFKDYIAMPKTNMYQSLHTTVIGPQGEPLEVQIRTREMHLTAEYGIAAHWAYKEGKPPKNAAEEAKRMRFLRELLEYQQEARSAKEFMESLKVDLFSDLVFVFTPKGDVIELPAGSVPIDFAYRIHTEIGNRMIGAKVNGKIVPLDYPLKTGDIVEILTSKQSYGPSQDWLKIAKSSHARNKIRAWFKKERREEMITRGRELLEQEAKRHHLMLKTLLREEYVKDTLERFNFQTLDELLTAVGYGGLSPTPVVSRLIERYRKDHVELTQSTSGTIGGALGSSASGTLSGANLMANVDPKTAQSKRVKTPKQGVRVKGIDGVLVRYSRCCNPVPGDEIIGFITRGRGVSVHRKDCPNVQHMAQGEEERLVEVSWETDSDAYYPVDIEVTGLDRHGLLNDVLQAVNETKTNLTQVMGRADKNRMAKITMTVTIRHVNELTRVVERIKRVKDVYAVSRMFQPS